MNGKVQVQWNDGYTLEGTVKGMMLALNDFFSVLPADFQTLPLVFSLLPSPVG